MGKKWLTNIELTDALRRQGEAVKDFQTQVARMTGRFLALTMAMKKVGGYEKLLEAMEAAWTELMSPQVEAGAEGEPVKGPEVRPEAGEFGRSEGNKFTEGGD